MAGVLGALKAMFLVTSGAAFTCKRPSPKARPGVALGQDRTTGAAEDAFADRIGSGSSRFQCLYFANMDFLHEQTPKILIYRQSSLSVNTNI